MKTVLHLSLIKRIAFIALVFFIFSSCRKEIDQAAKNTVDQAPKDTVQVTVLTAQQGCDALNRATITIQLIPVAAIPTPRYSFTTATAGNKLLLAGGRTRSWWLSRLAMLIFMISVHKPGQPLILVLPEQI